MEKIYSKVDPRILLHIIHRREDFESIRQDVVEDKEFLQMAAMNLPQGKTFKPHKHIWKEQAQMVIAQESWSVVRGSVKCTFYDTDDSIIAEPILYAGDCSITLQGGHNYESLEPLTWVREYKVGPYLGIALDKKFI